MDDDRKKIYTLLDLEESIYSLIGIVEDIKGNLSELDIPEEIIFSDDLIRSLLLDTALEERIDRFYRSIKSHIVGDDEYFGDEEDDGEEFSDEDILN